MVTVAIIEGHGRRPDGTHDPGAAGGGWTEQTATHHVALAFSRAVRAAGVDVPYDESRLADDPNYPTSATEANASGAAYVVSFHLDYRLAPVGPFALWIDGADRQLGEAIVDAVDAAGWARRAYSANPRTDLYLLRNVRAPVTIIECGRIGEAALDTAAELSAFGHAAAAGFLTYVGLDPGDTTMPRTITDDDLEAIVDAVRDAPIRARDPVHGGPGVYWTLHKALSVATVNAQVARRGVQLLARDLEGMRETVSDALAAAGLDDDELANRIVAALAAELTD